MKISLKVHLYKTVNLLFFMILIMVSCNKKDSTSCPSGANDVCLQNTAFNPSSITISTGTTITWTNADGVKHTVTSDNPLFDSGNLTDGKTFQYTFNNAGTIKYHCGIHSSMHGTIVVQ